MFDSGPPSRFDWRQVIQERIEEGEPMASRTQSDPGDMIASVGRSWGWILFFGVVTALAGIVITAHPGSSVYAFAILWGAWLFVGGIFRIVESIATPGESGGMRVLLALL